MNMELTETQKIIQDMAAKFAKRELEPVAAELDQTKNRDLLKTNLRKLAELGFMGLNIDPEYGGTGAGAVAFSLVMTEFGRACASTTVTTSVTNMVAECIQVVGNEEQKQKYIPPLAAGNIPPAASASRRPVRAPIRPGCAPRRSWTAILCPQRPQNLHHQRRVCRRLRGVGGDRQGCAEREGDQPVSGGARFPRLHCGKGREEVGSARVQHQRADL